MSKGKFGIAINCIDGRVQLPVIEWMKKTFGFDYIDMITEPGVDKVMSQVEDKRIELIKSKVEISVNAHGSKIIVIAGHFDCAGNSVSKEEHLLQIRKALKVIQEWKLNGVQKIIGIWIEDNKEIEVIDKYEND